MKKAGKDKNKPFKLGQFKLGQSERALLTSHQGHFNNGASFTEDDFDALSKGTANRKLVKHCKHTLSAILHYYKSPISRSEAHKMFITTDAFEEYIEPILDSVVLMGNRLTSLGQYMITQGIASEEGMQKTFNEVMSKAENVAAKHVLKAAGHFTPPSSDGESMTQEEKDDMFKSFKVNVSSNCDGIVSPEAVQTQLEEHMSAFTVTGGDSRYATTATVSAIAEETGEDDTPQQQPQTHKNQIEEDAKETSAPAALADPSDEETDSEVTDAGEGKLQDENETDGGPVDEPTPDGAAPPLDGAGDNMDAGQGAEAPLDDTGVDDTEA